jgi:hypothetical protein
MPGRSHRLGGRSDMETPPHRPHQAVPVGARKTPHQQLVAADRGSAGARRQQGWNPSRGRVGRQNRRRPGAEWVGRRCRSGGGGPVEASGDGGHRRRLKSTVGGEDGAVGGRDARRRGVIGRVWPTERPNRSARADLLWPSGPARPVGPRPISQQTSA